MIDMSPKGLSLEYAKMVTFRKKHTTALREIERMAAGNWYRAPEKDDGAAGQSNPENFVFTYRSFLLPELCFNSPAVRVKAKNPAQWEDIAKAVEVALANWLRESHFIEEAQLVVNDAIVGFGVFMVGVESADPVGGDSALRVYASWIPQDRFLIDPRCEHGKHARVWGHEYYRDAEVLAQQEGLDPAVVKRLENAEQDTQTNRERPYPKGEVPERRMVKLVDLYFPETRQICTLAGVEDGEVQAFYVRPPTQYWGPDSGPYQLLGMYDVPGDPYPVSALCATMEQTEEINAHLRAAAKEAATAKTFWLVDAAAKDVKDAMVNAVTGDVLAVRNLKNNAMKVETGAMSSQRMEYLQLRQESRDRTLAFGEAQRGRAEAGTTATDKSIASANADLRVEWMRGRTNRAMESVLRKVMWYLFYDPNVVMNVSYQDNLGNTIAGTYLGGPQEGQEDLDWTDMNLEIDPQSMQRSDDVTLQQRWLQVIGLVGQIAQNMTMMPQINWRWMLDQFGSTINQPNLSQIVFAQGMPMAGMPYGMDPNLMMQGQAIPQPALPGPMGSPGIGAGIPPVNSTMPGQRPALPQPGMGMAPQGMAMAGA